MFIVINYTANQLFVRRTIQCCNKLFIYLTLRFRNSTFTTCVLLLNRKKNFYGKRSMGSPDLLLTYLFTYIMLQVKCVLVDEVGRRCLWNGPRDKFGGHCHYYCQPPQPLMTAKRKNECPAGRPNMTNVIITYRPVKCQNDHLYCMPCLATWYLMREQAYTSRMVSRLTDKARERSFEEILKTDKRCPTCTVVGKFRRITTHTATPTAMLPTIWTIPS